MFARMHHPSLDGKTLAESHPQHPRPLAEIFHRVAAVDFQLEPFFASSEGQSLSAGIANGAPLSRGAAAF